MKIVEDKRLENPERCRVTEMVAQHEFICINRVHSTEKDDMSMLDSNGNPSRWRRHYFVRRYPIGDH